MRLTLSACAFAMLLAGCSSQAPVLVTVWRLDQVLAMPESAVHDPARGAIYVSNVNTYALDGNGFISRVQPDGSSIEQQWLTGLHSPTGVAMHDGHLYVADVNALVRIDPDQARVLARYPAPGTMPVLNDVAVTPAGEVFVSATAQGTLYRLVDGQLEPWFSDRQLLARANGLYASGGQLLHGGQYWQGFGLACACPVPAHIQPPAALADFDGITGDGADGLLVTLVDDPHIWHLDAHGNARRVTGPIRGIDLAWSVALDGVVVPLVGGGVALLRWQGGQPPP